ncbi:hypothetical protein CYLTODRAFT_278836 [Cylindrobasidium torrendii FP15055 ss-10]|uniref:Uncharacterized protein n=1 Tax=Cylindrobasidium torrendii FP15055 ss-10 TaxID=1314674 RepID=A0A0D7BBH2_9AGAR|nr:hypothetical protein CYLTODRAFT_278836 [Cylindrobasidium torrendii FP15055 ss-10]
MPSSPISPHPFQLVSPVRSRYPMFDLPSPTTAMATAMRPAAPPVSPQMARRAPLPPQDNLAPRWRPANTNGMSVDDDSDDEIIEIPPPYPRPQLKPTREASAMVISEPRKSPESRVSPPKDSATEVGSQIASLQDRAAALRRKLEDARLRTAVPPTPPRSHTPTSPIESASGNDVEMPSATASSRMPSPTGQQSSIPPSEPRAMKNLPKAPTFAIRKDLQARLAQTKLESVMVARPTAPTYPPTPSEDDNAAEERLRKLVLASKRKKPTAEPIAPPTPSPTGDVVMDDLPPPPTPSMDDLAMSFINDAIQSAAAPQAEALAHSTSTVPIPVNSLAVPDSQERDRLAMKQMALAERIRESKLFMHRLQTAQTKVEKLQIMKEMKKADEARAIKEKDLENRLQGCVFLFRSLEHR